MLHKFDSLVSPHLACSPALNHLGGPPLDMLINISFAFGVPKVGVPYFRCSFTGAKHSGIIILFDLQAKFLLVQPSLEF